jgi:hypothetical protein
LIQVSLRDKRYDAIFHLVTTAIGKGSFYDEQKQNYSIEEATKIDFRIINAWVGKPLNFFD